MFHERVCCILKSIIFTRIIYYLLFLMVLIFYETNQVKTFVAGDVEHFRVGAEKASIKKTHNRYFSLSSFLSSLVKKASSLFYPNHLLCFPFSHDLLWRLIILHFNYVYMDRVPNRYPLIQNCSWCVCLLVLQSKILRIMILIV